MYVITAETDGKLKFYGLDYNSGGYGYWSSSLSGAKIFATDGEAAKVLESSEFTKSVPMSDGAVYPPSMVHSAANLSYEKPSGVTTISVQRIDLTALIALHHEVSIPPRK